MKIGAALMLDQIEHHRDWLFGAARDIELQDFVAYDAYRDGWRETAARVKPVLDGFTGRLGIHGPVRGLEIDNPDAEMQERITARLIEAVEVCAAIASRQIVIHSPFTPWTKHHRHAWGGNAAIIETARHVLGPVLSLAETHGVTLVVENIRDPDPIDRREMIEAIGSKALALSIDTGHAHLARHWSGAPPVDFFIRDAGDLLQHVHLQDLDGYADRHWPPGHGALDWPPIFAALAACDSAPHVVLELEFHEDVPAGFTHLQSLGLVE